MNLSDRDDFLHNMAYAFCRWKYVVVGTFLILVAMVFFAGYMMNPTWQTEFHMLAEPTLPPATAGFPDPTRPKREFSADMYSQHVVRTLQGKELAIEVVQKFGLDERMRRKAEEPRTLREKFMASIFGAIDVVITTVVKLLGGEEGEMDWVDEAADDFRKGLFAWIAVDVISESDIVELQVNGETPELANEIADFMVEALRRKLSNVSGEAAEAAIVAFQQELKRAVERQEEAERALQAFVESNKGVQPSESARLKTTELAALHAQRGRLMAEKSELERQSKEDAPGTDASQGVSASSDRILDNAVIMQLRANIHAQRVRLAALLEEVTVEHPDVVTARSEIRQTEKELDTEVRSVLRAVDAELRSRNLEIEALEADLASIPAKEFEYSRLVADIEAFGLLRRQLQAHVDTLDVTAESGIGSLNIKVIARSYVSLSASPDMPSWLIVALVAVCFAGGVAVILPPFIEYWRDPVRGPSDVADSEIVLLAVIPKLSHEKLQHSAVDEAETS